MKSLITTITLIGYFAVLALLVPAATVSWAPWISALASLLFVVTFTLSSPFQPWVAVSVVFFATVATPLILLVLVGSSGGTSDVLLALTALLNFLWTNGQLHGFEILAPFIFSLIGALLVGKFRSNDLSIRLLR